MTYTVLFKTFSNEGHNQGHNSFILTKMKKNIGKNSWECKIVQQEALMLVSSTATSSLRPTIPAIHWSARIGLKRNFTLVATIGANGFVHFPGLSFVRHVDCTSYFDDAELGFARKLIHAYLESISHPYKLMPQPSTFSIVCASS